jgi:hypothetical protein
MRPEWSQGGCEAFIDFDRRWRSVGGMRTTGAVLVAAGVGALVALAGGSPLPAAAAPAPASAPHAPLIALAQAQQPIERQIGSAARNVVREVRRYFRTLGWMFGRAADWWGNWIKRASFYILVAVVAALADGSLVNAWRLEGLRVLATYVPMMLYVYARLLFSAGVKLAPKLVLVGAIVYGLVWRDLLPDRRWVPGRMEDILLIVLATRAFVYACPEELVDRYAERAVTLRRRMMTFQRARTR